MNEFNVDKAVTRARVITALRATDALDNAMPDGTSADSAMNILNLALDGIENAAIRRCLIGRAERGGHDMSVRRAVP